MQTHNITQGSPEWLAHRAQFFNASDAPAMMGCSPYKSRQQLLTELATGITPEVDAATQRRFDEGHRIEALARPIAEEIIGEELFPVVGTEGPLGASFDGLTMMEDIAFEHKTLNDELRAVMLEGCTGADLPLQYRVQMEHQCLVAGCKRVLFVASKWRGDTPEDVRHCWYESDDALAEQIIRGWDQFRLDLEAYKPAAPDAPAAVGAVIESLPALVVTVEGRVTASNLIAFKEAAGRFIDNIKTDLQTDQDFADAEQTVKFCKDGEDRLALVKQQALAQTASIEELFQTIDHISEQMRAKRLSLDKLVKARKEQIRAEIVAEAQAELDAHVATLNARLGGSWVPRTQGQFGEAIKGKKTVASVRDATHAALASAKIEASALADRLQINRQTLTGDGHDWAFLFPDFGAVGGKSAEDFAAVLALRVGRYREDEQRRKLAQAQADEQKRALEASAEAAAAAPTAAAPAQSAAPTIPAVDPGATIKLGDIAQRLGFTLTQAFIEESLGIKSVATDKRAVLFAEADWPRLCDALIAHIERLNLQIR